MASSPQRALIVVDVQVDFCEKGALGVEGGNAVAALVAARIRAASAAGDLIVTSQDWHIDPAGHFAPDGDDPDYENTWPVHCMADTPGAALHPLITQAISEVPAQQLIAIHKGQHKAAYSAFDGRTVDGAMTLDGILSARGVKDVDVVGIATDHCVRKTALDAQLLGYTTHVDLEMCAGVAAHTTERAIQEMQTAGALVHAGPRPMITGDDRQPSPAQPDSLSPDLGR